MNTRFPHALLLTAAFALPLAAPSLARAQTPAASDASARADALIHEGVVLRQQGHDAEALERFNQAYAAFPSPRARAQQGLAEQALGRWGAAARHLGEALSSASDPWIQRQAPTLNAAMQAINQHVGRLEVSANVEGAQVLVDGEALGTLPLRAALVVTAGRSALEVRAPGYVSVLRQVEIAAGSLARESVTLIADAGARPAPSGSATPANATASAGGATSTTGSGATAESSHPTGYTPASEPRTAVAPARAEPAEEPASMRGYLGLGVAALGVVALGVGVAGNVVREQNASNWNQQCSVDAASYTPDAVCNGYASGADTGQTMALVGYIAGGVLIAGGAVLWLTAPRGHSPPGPVARAVRCGPWVGGAGLTCAGTF